MPSDAAQPAETPGAESSPEVADEARPEPGGVERDHDQPDRFRYDPLRPPSGYAAMAPVLFVPASPGPTTYISAAAGRPSPFPTSYLTAEPLPVPVSPAEPLPVPVSPAEPLPVPVSPAETSPAAASLASAAPLSLPAPAASLAPMSPAPLPAPAPLAAPAPAGPTSATGPTSAAGPDELDLPELDDRNRPTISLDRGAVPGQGRTRPPEPLPPPTGNAATDGRLAKLENSPFWLDDAERAVLPDVLSHTAERGGRARRGAIRKPAPALVALITLALTATFFAWVSAEPFWLAVGRGHAGFATTTGCHGTGMTQRCAGRFDAADGSFTVRRVNLLGVTGDNRAPGTITPARMVSSRSRTAYLSDTGLFRHLRWILGFLLVLVCGLGIASLTGARRLGDARSRRLAILASLAAPLALLAGFLLAAY